MYLYCIAVLKDRGPTEPSAIKNAASEDSFNAGIISLIFVSVYKKAVHINFPEI